MDVHLTGKIWWQTLWPPADGVETSQNLQSILSQASFLLISGGHKLTNIRVRHK